MPRRPPSPTLLASTAELPAIADTPVRELRVPVPVPRPPAPAGDPAGRAPTPGRLYLWLAVLTLALGALSLLAPSTPSYDPWSWNLWAREIIHGQLVITDTGTSWKPLPMLFTIPFALLGRAGPDLWLAVARAGAIGAVLMALRLAHRLTGELAAARLEASRSSLAVRAPAAFAGVTAVVALGFAAKGSYISANGLGYSEALAAALLLVAIECHLDGRHRATFLVGFLVALDRPEIWLFWVPYGIWLGRRDPRMRAVIAACFVAQPIAWFVPVYLGSGHFGSSVARATDPRANSLAYAHHPFVAELAQAALPTIMMRIKLMGALVVLGAGAVLWRMRAAARTARPAATDGAAARPVLVAALLGLGGMAWFVVIAVMTESGFSGNNRYLVLGAALVDVCAAVGFGWLAIELIRACHGVRGGGARFAAMLGTAVSAAVFALAPAWIGSQDFVSLPRLHGALFYQAKLRDDLGHAITLAGGRARVLACGSVMTEGFQVPMVAYALDVPTTRVLASPVPGAPAGPAPDVILQTRATRSSSQLPRVRSWNPAGFTYRGSAGPWNTFTGRCAARS